MTKHKNWTKWAAINIFGEWQYMPTRTEYTQAWTEGWDDAMEYGDSATNHFEPGSNEFDEWQRGYEAAMED